MIKLQAKSQIINHDEKLQLVRVAPRDVVYQDGKPVITNSEPECMVCNVQPVNGRDLLIVPEGDRFKEQYWVFTNPQTAIVVNDTVIRKDPNTQSDVKFQVQSVENWGSYSRARIMRIDTGPDRSS